jgi:hypothetical protein
METNHTFPVVNNNTGKLGFFLNKKQDLNRIHKAYFLIVQTSNPTDLLPLVLLHFIFDSEDVID